MIVRVLASKIKHAWGLIASVVTQVDGVKEQDREAYLTELLYALLNNRAQCHLRLGPNEVKTLVITRFPVDRITGEKQLLLQSYYAFEKSDDNEWAENMQYAVDLAKKEGCTKVIFNSLNPKILEMANRFNFKEDYRMYSVDIGGV